MNYLTEILEFYNWLEENPSSSSVIVLWHGLMSINNKLKWKESFTAPIKTLELKTGLKKDAIYRARNTLKQHGLIDFKERGGNKCSEYTIIPFASVVLNDADRDTNSTHAATHTSTHTERSPQPLYKQNNNKINKTYNKKTAFTNFKQDEYDYDALEEKILDMMIEG